MNIYAIVFVSLIALACVAWVAHDIFQKPQPPELKQPNKISLESDWTAEDILRREG